MNFTTNDSFYELAIFIDRKRACSFRDILGLSVEFCKAFVLGYFEALGGLSRYREPFLSSPNDGRLYVEISSQTSREVIDEQIRLLTRAKAKKVNTAIKPTRR